MCLGLVWESIRLQHWKGAVTPPSTLAPCPDLLLLLLKEYGKGRDLGGHWNFSIQECPTGKIYTKPKRSWGYGKA